MSDLFEQVFHHIEGTETEIQNWHTLDGIKTVEFRSFGPDRWIESVHERSRMTGIECLAMILFEVDVSFSDPEPARRIVEDWAVELRKAVSAGEIQARDPVTLLKLETLPDGWEWLLSMTDADKFIAARGMEWRFGEVALHLFNEFKQAIENRRFPPWERATKQPAPAQTAATPEPVVAREVRSGNVLTLPNGHTHVRVGELPLLIADAQWPNDGTDDEEWEANHPYCWIDSESEIKEAVLSGDLPIKKPSTLAPFTYLQGNAWKSGLVTVADLHIYLAERGMTLKIADAPEHQATTPSPAPLMQDKAKRRTWLDVASPYIVEIMRTGQYATAKELFNALEAKAGSDSPFDKGTGNNRFNLFIRELAMPLSMKTVQNNWQKLLNTAAQK